MAQSPRPYHHGDLPRALIAAALELIDEAGPAALSLREVARRAGVSHGAPAHHFGDKAGLLTAVAAQGYELLGAALADAFESTGEFREVGVAYVRFALSHRAHFEVMFRPDLYRDDDPAVVSARARSSAMLYGPPADLSVDAVTGVNGAVAAWSLVHGFATLWLSGNLERAVPGDPEDAARAITGFLSIRR